MNSKEKQDKNTENNEDEETASQKSAISDAVYKEIARLNGQINAFNLTDLTAQLKKCKLDTNGHIDVLRKRLKTHYKNRKLATSNILSVRKLFPYYVIIDFEATCNVNNPDDYPYEIIEFPAVLVNTEKLTIADHFQAYVKPVLNPHLSDFCVKLTGITQEQVDNAEEFPIVLNKFEAWLKKHKLGTKHKFVAVTDGPWDMRRFLYGQCLMSEVPFPNFGKKWVNLRKVFSAAYKCNKMRLQLMLDHLGLEFEGRPHCGLDDAKNIGRILLRMIEDGVSVEINERIHLNSPWLPKFKIPNKSSNETVENTQKDLEDNNTSTMTYTKVLTEGKTSRKKNPKENTINGCKTP